MKKFCEDARISLTGLAKKVGINRETLTYRIKRLETEGIITGYTARINLSYFGGSTYVILFKVKKVSKETINKIIKLGKVHWLARISGEYDLHVSFSVSNSLELREIIEEMVSLIDPVYYSVNTVIDQYVDDFQKYFTDKNVNILTSFNRCEANKLSVKDERIIELLTKNGRISLSEIAKDVDVSVENVRYRMSKLKKAKVILGYRTKLNPKKLDYTNFYLLIKFHKNRPQIYKKLKYYFEQHTNTIYAERLLGTYDILVGIYVRNLEEYTKHVKDLQDNFPEIQSISSNLLLEVDEHSYV